MKRLLQVAGQKRTLITMPTLGLHHSRQHLPKALTWAKVALILLFLRPELRGSLQGV